MAQKLENRANLFRIQILIIDGGLFALRNKIDRTLTTRGITLSACLNNEKTTINGLKSRRIITQVQYDQLFPTGGQVPTTSDMDITLIICLLRSLKFFGLNKKFNWNATPLLSDTSVEADICRLKAYRNKISHIAETTAIQAKDFATWWNDIEQILVRLSSPSLNIQQMIARFKVCPLDEEEEKRVQEEMKKWKNQEADVDRLKNEMTKVKKRVSDVEKDVDDIKRRRQDEGVSSTLTEEEKYQKRKKELKNGLIIFYKIRHSKVFLSPLFEEKDTPLASFYIRPDLSSIVSTLMKNEDRIPVRSLSEIFKTENKQNLEIYVVADAGIGKTAFSKYLANVWCQAHCPDEDINKLFLKDDIECMHEFEFLFLVLLRDSDDLCSIDELIFEKIVSNLGLKETLSKNALLEILNDEKCLVILDGLDEWTHPDNEKSNKKCYRSPKSIPHRNDREKCTVLTTSRPWKLGILGLDSCQFGKKVELTKLSYDSAVKLTERILQRWKSPQNKDALQSDVKQIISNKHNAELAFVPLLLIYMTCLWCDGVQIGSSKCDLYTNIVELLLSRTIKLHGELQQSQELSSSDIPKCFAEYDNCTKYYPLLMHLGKLAYYTLFNETKENTLVFDGSVVRKYLKPDELKFSLLSGMLSENTSNTSRKMFSKVSFSHKTVQEFFTAIFLSFQNDVQKIVLEKCRNIQDILDMSKIYEFIIEMNSDRMFAISNDLMSVINKDEKTLDYRARIGYEDMYENPLHNIQGMFMSCLQEMPENENIQLCLQDFFIAGNNERSKQLQRLLKQNKTNIKSLYINTLYISSSLREIIDRFSLTDFSHIQKLYFNGNIFKESKVNRILFPSLQNVYLANGQWTNDEENLSEILARVQNLQYVCIEYSILPHKILETIFNFISGQKSMKELTLGELTCNEHRHCDGCRLNLDLSQHSTLRKVDLMKLPRLQLNITSPSLVNAMLRDVNLDDSSVLLSRDMLNIELVALLNIKMSAGNLQNFITLLENLPQAVTVQLYYKESETEYKRVREHIWRSQTFHVLQDYDDNDDSDDNEDGDDNEDDVHWREIVFKTKKPSKE